MSTPITPEIEKQAQELAKLCANGCHEWQSSSHEMISRVLNLPQLLADQAKCRELEQSRDDWKCRAESFDRQGYEVARERDSLRAELNQAKIDLAEARRQHAQEMSEFKSDEELLAELELARKCVEALRKCGCPDCEDYHCRYCKKALTAYDNFKAKQNVGKPTTERT